MWAQGVGQAAPTVVGAQMLAPMAPRFDVGSLSRLAPEWGQMGTGTLLGASTLVDQGDPRVGVPVVALVHPSNQWRVRWPPQAGVGHSRGLRRVSRPKLDVGSLSAEAPKCSQTGT